MLPRYLIKKSFATKLFDSENSDSTTTLMRNVVKLVLPLFIAKVLPNTALARLAEETGFFLLGIMGFGVGMYGLCRWGLYF